MDTFPDVDAYLASLPPEARDTLSGIRQSIWTAVPDAVESIAYGMPGYKYKGRPLIYFAAAKDHLGLYGTPGGTLRFKPGAPPSVDELTRLLAGRVAAIDAAAAQRKARRTRQ